MISDCPAVERCILTGYPEPLPKYPVCDICGDEIVQERFLHILGCCICDECIDRNKIEVDFDE